MPDPRTHDQGPVRVASYGHEYGYLHDRIVGDEKPDDTLSTRRSNRAKVDYICTALRIDPTTFHLDIPFPLEDWLMSDDMSLLTSGLYFACLRREFLETLLETTPALRQTEAFKQHADAQYWNFAFNFHVTKRNTGELVSDPRVLH